jgi:hypothetical protein
MLKNFHSNNNSHSKVEGTSAFSFAPQNDTIKEEPGEGTLKVLNQIGFQ